MDRWSEDIITAELAGTLDGLFYERVHRSKSDIAYRWFDRSNREWVDTTWDEMGQAVSHWQTALAGENLERGDRVALMHRNSKEWVIFEQAALGLGLVVVPMYTDDRPDNVAYIVDDAAIKLMFVGDAVLWRRIAPALEQAGSLQRVLLLDEEGKLERSDDPRLVVVREWLPGAASSALNKRQADPDTLATIVYTSGTTGRPKGVMLSHTNILSIAHSVLVNYSVYRQDLLLSFLPLSHTFERTLGYYLPMMSGSTVAYARSVQQLAEDLLTIKPTALVAVPRIFERIYSRIQHQLEKKSKLARFLFLTTVSVGWKRFEYRQGRRSLGLWSLWWPLMDRLVASGIRAKLGGRTRLIVSGGAALPEAISKVFLGLGLNILQGYGMTETSPVVCGNQIDDNDPASVGIALRHVQVKIGEDDELLVRGPGVMLGYWNNHAATAATIDADGWLHSGDQARIEGKHIYITGRIKDILVLSNGEKVPPGDMEQAIMLDPLFEQVIVVGEGRSFLSLIAVLESQSWFKFAQQQGVDPTVAGNLDNEKIKKAMLRRIKQQLSDFPGYAKIRKIKASLEPWTVENDLLTPTLKVKRAKVLQRYEADVEGMYR